MKKVLEFLKSNMIVIKWSVWYFFILWAILKFIFRFDIFSYRHWWIFFHATLHGFGGFVFGALIYAAIPLYIATSIITYHKQELIIPIPFANTLSKIISKIFPKKQETAAPVPEEPQEDIKLDEITEPEYPADLPPELRIPFKRAKNRMPLTGAVSVYNRTNNSSSATNSIPQQNIENEQASIPIPMDFDITDDISQDTNDSVPTFTDINFDTPIATEQELTNNTTKYLRDKNIEYETYHDFVATTKFVIYEHSDTDFWILDGDSWFAAGKQKDSPIQELIDLAKQNELIPVLYLASQNIMDIENTISKFESSGIRVIKSLDELD